MIEVLVLVVSSDWVWKLLCVIPSCHSNMLLVDIRLMAAAYDSFTPSKFIYAVVQVPVL